MTPVVHRLSLRAPSALAAALALALAGACASQAIAPRPAAVDSQPRRPFPQHAGFPGCPDCIRPTLAQDALDEDVVDYYEDWKKLFTRISSGDIAGELVLRAGAAGAVEGWPAGVGPITQSEAHGYGMIVMALMAGKDPLAKAYFDSLNRVRKAFPSSVDPRLMSWVVPDNGSKAMKPQGPATDGDMDMAYALLLAHDQWGDEDRNHYLAEARSIIAGMEATFITHGQGKFYPRLNIGDPQHTSSGAPESKPHMTRPSDFTIGHMRAFRGATGNQVWSDLEAGSLNILLAVRHRSTGLVPDFVAGDPPVPSKTGTGDEDVCYSCYDYNACRVPWRQAVAIAHHGVAGSRDLGDKMVSWARRKYGDNPARMGASFTLEGVAKESGDNAFTSPMVASAITHPDHQAWLDKGWAYMRRSSRAYYGGSITLLSMLLVSGNWWAPSAGTGVAVKP
jgi:endo-1,4-beta-D-glucanase Y